MTQLLQQIKDYIGGFFNRFPPGRRTTVAIVFFVTIGGAAALLMWAFRPQYRVLYSGLSLEDSNQIIEVLLTEKIPHRLDQEGTRILVPSSQIYTSRLKLAGEELPTEHGTGWELFDKTNIGMTDFVQKLNYRRGLEGEIARTILQLDPIEAVRVHLVIPEERLFRANQTQAMASVSIKVRRGQKMSSRQVEGITFLVSSAVDGLESENVTVVDSRGVVLSERIETDPVMRLTATQIEIQRQIESNLTRKGQEILEKRFGAGKSTIQVTADLDFQQVEHTREIYDADNPSVRSEEVTLTSTTDIDTSSSRNESTITNYELNLTREHIVNPVGVIKRLSVAAMVDGIYQKTVNPETEEISHEFVPLNTQQLDEVSSTIMAALGFNQIRGDEINVISVPFQDVSMLDREDLLTVDRWELMSRYGQKVVTVIAIVLLLLMVRNFLKKAQEAVIQPPAEGEGLPQLGEGPARAEGIPGEPSITESIEDRIGPEAANAAMLQEQVTNFVTEKPEMASKLVRSWLIDSSKW